MGRVDGVELGALLAREVPGGQELLPAPVRLRPSRTGEAAPYALVELLHEKRQCDEHGHLDMVTSDPVRVRARHGRFRSTWIDISPAQAGTTVDLPLTEDNFQLIDLAAFDPDTPNLLVSRPLGQKGWYLALEEQERVSAQAFNLLGVTFFSSFVADVATSSGETTCDNADIRAENTCSKSGFSKVFVTSTVNARPFVSDPDTMDPFFKIAGAFVSEPFTEIGYSSDGPADDGGGGGPGGGGPGGGGGPNPGDLTDEERAVMEALRDLFPENCRFTNQRIDVRLVTSDTQVRRIAAVPVCVIEKNWKEF